MIISVSFPVPKQGGVREVPQAGLALCAGRRLRRADRGGVRVAVTGAASHVFRVTAMETALKPELHAGCDRQRQDVRPTGSNADMHGSAEYRAAMITVLAQRGVAAALAR